MKKLSQGGLRLSGSGKWAPKLSEKGLGRWKVRACGYPKENFEARIWIWIRMRGEQLAVRAGEGHDRRRKRKIGLPCHYHG